MSSLSNYRIDNKGNLLIITIPSQKNWVFIIFIGFSFILGAFFLTAIIAFMAFSILVLGLQVTKEQSLYEGVEAACLIFLFFMPALFIVVSITGYALYSAMWHISGKEIIKVNPHLLTVRREILGICRPKKYRLKHVHNLRVLSENTSHLANYLFFGSLWVLLSVPKGKIAFDHPFGTYHWGINLDLDEATELVAIIKEYLPQYRNV